MQDASQILWPVFLQVLLTFAVYVVLARRRFGSVKRGEHKLSEFKYGTGGANHILLATRNLANQFELPVLFYTLVVVLIVTAEVTTLQVVLAWVFVVSRYIHAFGHVQDILKPRLYGFFAGLGVMALMWLIFALQIGNLI